MLKVYINQWVDRVHEWAHRKGFYPNPCNPPCVHASGGFAGEVMLVVTELSEAVEGDRKGDVANRNEEIADAVIRS